MLNAKLFAGLAAIMLAIAFLGARNPLHYLGLTSLTGLLNTVVLTRHESGTVLIVTGFYAHLYFALICAALALAYFGVTRFARRQPNLTIGLMSFALVALGIVIKLGWPFLTRGQPVPESNIGLFLAYAAAYNCFSLGALLSVAVLVWSLLSGVVARWRTFDRRIPE